MTTAKNQGLNFLRASLLKTFLWLKRIVKLKQPHMLLLIPVLDWLEVLDFYNKNFKKAKGSKKTTSVKSKKRTAKTKHIRQENKFIGLGVRVLKALTTSIGIPLFIFAKMSLIGLGGLVAAGFFLYGTYDVLVAAKLLIQGHAGMAAKRLVMGLSKISLGIGFVLMAAVPGLNVVGWSVIVATTAVMAVMSLMSLAMAIHRAIKNRSARRVTPTAVAARVKTQSAKSRSAEPQPIVAVLPTFAATTAYQASQRRRKSVTQGEKSNRRKVTHRTRRATL